MGNNLPKLCHLDSEHPGQDSQLSVQRQVMFNSCTINILQGTYLTETAQALLNVSNDPFKHKLLKKQGIAKLSLQYNSFVDLKIPDEKYEYVLNVKVTPMIQDTEERTQLYFKCLDQVAKQKMTSILYQELLYLHNDEEQIKNIQCLISAIFQQIKWTSVVRIYTIISPCNRTCQIFCDELAKFYIRSMKNQSPQTFEYGDTLNTIKEEFSMQSSYYQDVKFSKS
ncbi:hypothetical protein pb186bvf_020691 [Paramecium bursaria]